MGGLMVCILYASVSEYHRDDVESGGLEKLGCQIHVSLVVESVRGLGDVVITNGPVLIIATSPSLWLTCSSRVSRVRGFGDWYLYEIAL